MASANQTIFVTTLVGTVIALAIKPWVSRLTGQQL